MTEDEDGDYPLYMTVKWGFVFSKLEDAYRVQIVGPRTLPAKAHFRSGEYFWGIVANADSNLIGYSKKDLLNTVVEIDVVHGKSFSLGSNSLEIPTYNELDVFVDMLIRQRILYSTPITAASQRDQQRKAKHFTGLTPKQIEQADRVEQAIAIINDPHTLSWIATETGFADQAHMNRDFRRLVGYSPAEIRTMFNSQKP